MRVCAVEIESHGYCFCILIVCVCVCAVEIESLLPLLWRRNIFDELKFDEPLEFDNGDAGPSGGIQVSFLCALSLSSSQFVFDYFVLHSILQGD